MNVQKARNLSNVLREIYRETDPPGRTYRPTLSAHHRAVVRGAQKAVGTIKALALFARLTTKGVRP